MIELLKIKNFKSIKNIQLKAKRVNVFIGVPNSGKSNIFEALGLISSLKYHKEAKDTRCISNDFVRYNTLLNLFRDNNPKNVIEVETNELKLKVEKEDSEIKFNLCKYPKKEEKEEKNDTEYVLKLDNNSNILSSIGSEDKIFESITKILFYRFTPQKEFPLDNFSFLLPPQGKNFLTILQSNGELQETFIDILSSYNLKINIRLDEKKVEIAKDNGILITYPLDLIADTFYYLFMHLAVLQTVKNSIIVLEEPETHLFPYYSKYLSEGIALDDSNNQYFISTHNPYFLTSIAEKTPINDLALFIVSYEKHETVLYKVTDEQMQEIDDWDNIFFNLERYKE